MKRQFIVSLLILLSIQAVGSAKGNPAFLDNHPIVQGALNATEDTGGDYKKGELLVRFADADIQSTVRKLAAGPLSKRAARNAFSNLIVPGAAVHKELDSAVAGLALVKLPAGMSVRSASIQFSLSPGVVYAEPDYKYQLCAQPRDARYKEQWALYNTGQTGGTYDADIDANDAWDIQKKASNIIVAVTDTGIDYTHPDLRGRLWVNVGEDIAKDGIDVNDVNNVDDDHNGYADDFYGYDFAGNAGANIYDGDSDVTDYMYHGTHVSGIIGAAEDANGVVGVCWDVNIMTLKIFADDGIVAYISDIVPAIGYAIDNGAKIINASWGGFGYSQALYDSILNARNNNILFVAAAMNESTNSDSVPSYPSGYGLDNVISVMATDHFDNMAYYSNYGATSVDIAAPGGDTRFGSNGGILSTLPMALTSYMTADGLFPVYDSIQGTSMAAPHVSGAAALIKSLRPSWTYQRIKDVLLYSADRLPSLQGRCVSGGRLNLEKALKMAKQGNVRLANGAAFVGGNYSSIGAAISAATAANYEVIVESGRWFFENVDFGTKKIVLRSGNTSTYKSDGSDLSPQTTFISGLFNGGRIVEISGSQSSTSAVKGLTIRDGTDSGIWCSGTSPKIYNCIITGNTAADGAGIYCNNGSAPDINNCTISDNTALDINNTATSGDGGGIYCDNGSDPNITNSTITDNTAEWNGGGIYCGGGSDPDITGCTVEDNRADFEGGGIYCEENSAPDIIYNTIRDNSAQDNGGGIGCYSSSPLIKNCLIIDNSVDSWDGGGIYANDSSPAIINCTISDNSTINSSGLGGGLACSYSSDPNVKNCIFSGNRNYAVSVYYYDTGDISEPNLTYNLFYGNTGGDYANYNEIGAPPVITKYTGASAINGLANASNNIDGKPMFVAGRLGNYYLSQGAAGQILDENGAIGDANSPAVNAGSANASTLGLDVYSTRTDNVNDAGVVDIGYHYKDPQAATTYNLTVNVTPSGKGFAIFADPNNNDVSTTTSKVVAGYKQYSQVALEAVGGPDPCNPTYQFKSWSGTNNDGSTALTNVVTMSSSKTVIVTFETIMIRLRTRVLAGEAGTIVPSRERLYPRGTVVDLIATPANPAHVIIWYGTDDDLSGESTNTVTMSVDPQVVEVEFYASVIRYVGGDGQYPTIQSAIDAAHTRDIVQIAPANEPYITSLGYLVTKNITITSANPNDPCCVASTVIEQEVVGEQLVGPAFTFRDVGQNTVLNGITLSKFRRYGGDGLDGTTGNPDGANGGWVDGGAIVCENASPIIKNCVVVDCNVIGGIGGNGMGGNAAAGHPEGYDGGWPGFAYGGALAIWGGGSLTIINTTFDNCRAEGGDGGDGGDGLGAPNYSIGGRGGGWTQDENSRWYGIPWTYGYQIDPNWKYNYTGYYDSHSKYSGLGGAIYVSVGSSLNLIDCKFINNVSQGGLNGICGLDRPIDARYQPAIRWKIDNFGGAIHFAGNNTGLIENCTFINNTADTNSSPAVTDSFISYGGAIDFEDGANITIRNCTFNGNSSAIGGALHGTWSDPVVSNCNFIDNTAYHGGGALFVGGAVQIDRSDFSGNTATLAIAQGGGICSLGADFTIKDCNVSNNDAAGSGGGIYVSNKDFSGQLVSDNNIVYIKNCLITNNTAGRDGAGVSINWYSEPNIVNCTIADNVVTRVGFNSGYGGGLACSYGSYANVLNSIFWNNLAQYGPQISIGTGFEYDPRYSTMNITYSDVKGSQSAVHVDNGCTLNWDISLSNPNYPSNIFVNPKFVAGPLGRYYLEHADTGDPTQTGYSPCISVGSDMADIFGLHRYTTRTDNGLDKGRVDMGYHYQLEEIIDQCRYSDLYLDGTIDFKDLAVFLSNWLEQDCADANGWCGGADLNFDTEVDFEDFAMMVDCRDYTDDDAPEPDPAEWQVVPYSLTLTSTGMTAREVIDGWGLDVVYFFDCVYGDCNDSGWTYSRTYTDTGLDPNTEYGYRVRASDFGYDDVNDPNGQFDPDDPDDPNIGNKTAWSQTRYIVTDASGTNDTTPPTPNPMQWVAGGEPSSASPTSIAMTAAIATDESGGAVEYYFQCVSGGGNDRTWSTDRTYTDTGLTTGVEYGYTVKARDARYNETAASSVGYAIPGQAQSPPAFAISSALQLSQSVGGGKCNWYHRITVNALPNDGSGRPMYYRFVDVSFGVFSSVWSVTPAAPGSSITNDALVKTNSYTGQQCTWRVDISYNADGSNPTGSTPVTILQAQNDGTYP